jgi:hypothetical protein
MAEDINPIRVFCHFTVRAILPIVVGVVALSWYAEHSMLDPARAYRQERLADEARWEELYRVYMQEYETLKAREAEVEKIRADFQKPEVWAKRNPIHAAIDRRDKIAKRIIDYKANLKNEHRGLSKAEKEKAVAINTREMESELAPHTAELTEPDEKSPSGIKYKDSVLRTYTEENERETQAIAALPVTPDFNTPLKIEYDETTKREAGSLRGFWGLLWEFIKSLALRAVGFFAILFITDLIVTRDLNRLDRYYFEVAGKATAAFTVGNIVIPWFLDGQNLLIAHGISGLTAASWYFWMANSFRRFGYWFMEVLDERDDRRRQRNQPKERAVPVLSQPAVAAEPRPMPVLPPPEPIVIEKIVEDPSLERIRRVLAADHDDDDLKLKAVASFAKKKSSSEREIKNFGPDDL